MGRAERRLEGRTKRRYEPTAGDQRTAGGEPRPVVGTVGAASGRRRLAAVFSALMGLVIVLAGTLGNLPVSTPVPLEPELLAALEAAGQEGRPIDPDEVDLFAALPADLPRFAATASGLGERTPDRIYRASVRVRDKGKWTPAIGYRFSGDPVNLADAVWSSVVVWVGVDPLQTIFATGFERFIPPSLPPVTPSPSAAPSGSPSAAPSGSPSAAPSEKASPTPKPSAAP